MRKSNNISTGAKPANQGEGNRTAALSYDKQAQRFAKSGKVAEKAQEALHALDGPDAAELARAEAEGKSHGAGADAPKTQT